MIKMTLSGVCMFIVVGLVGCVPTRSAYYRISSPTGEIAGGCGTIGKSSSLTFTRGDVKFWIHEIFRMENQATLEMSIFVPKEDKVELDWSQLQAINDQTGNPVSSEPFEVFVSTVSNDAPLSALRHGSMKLQPGVVLDGDRYPFPVGEGVYSSYDIVLKNFPMESTPAFDLRIPDMTVNGTPYPGFVVHYQMTTSFWLEPVNC